MTDKDKKCSTCNGTKKVIEMPDGERIVYLPALASDAHHKGVKVIKCPECTNEK
jgi:hypothetical protein